MPDYIQAREWYYYYNTVNMRQLDSEHFLRSGNSEALG